MAITLDIEAKDLLNDNTIDYTASPYKIKDDKYIHCIVIEKHETGEIVAFYDGSTYVFDGRHYEEEGSLGYVYTLRNYVSLQYTHYQLHEFPQYIKDNPEDKIVGHNIINYDLLALKLCFGLPYTVEPDSFAGSTITIEDTLVLSKTLNPDRYGGHSLDKLSEKVGLRKIDFRPYVNKEDKFKEFAADMLYYCIRDVQVNTRVYFELLKEAKNWDWSSAISLEKKVAEIVTRQEHRGFWFNKELAETNIAELDALMEERRLKVEPVIPRKKATKTFMKDFLPPKDQFLKSGEPNQRIINFINKHNGTLDKENKKAVLFEKEYTLPIPHEPLITEQIATIDDTTHIKEWLVREFGWQPTEYKERDLSCDSKKKKLPRDKFLIVIDKYVEQTLTSPFCDDRLEFLGVSRDKLKDRLLKTKEGRACKVLTNPSFTVGQEKEIDPKLLEISDKFPFAKDVVEYLTYKHRRNSILGGGLDWDDEEEAEKGYMSAVRSDGRISTPADTCGTSTSRFKHRTVANIPRVTSLYGDKMRGMFGVDKCFVQIGYDFDSLEAREEAHYCYPYDVDKEYCESLLLAKPNDVHSVMARKISAIIMRDFARSPAKSVKYAATYGATAPKVAKTIGADLATGELVVNAFWDAAAPLKKLKDKLQTYWQNQGGGKFILGIDGRKVPTRSAHSILNSLFQSAGVICAKRAMVIHDKKLKDAGLLVDFFVDNWKDKTFCQQLIAYHDESQLEVSKSLVNFKIFDKEEQAKEWKTRWEKDNQKVLSDIGHRGDKYYLGYCLAGELAVQAVKEAGEYYKLRVALTAGYMLGDSWGSCH